MTFSQWIDFLIPFFCRSSAECLSYSSYFSVHFLSFNVFLKHTLLLVGMLCMHFAYKLYTVSHPPSHTWNARDRLNRGTPQSHTCTVNWIQIVDLPKLSHNKNWLLLCTVHVYQTVALPSPGVYHADLVGPNVGEWECVRISSKQPIIYELNKCWSTWIATTSPAQIYG